ncbi:hypothetical protein [Paenibacillus solani]|uniref:hypothetical protein n=1 Tax=Paenibacillus solani TaxID=1705565 RepID=UPI003D293709
MKMNKKTTIIALGAALAVSGTSVYASDSFTNIFSYKTDNLKEQQHIKNVENKLVSSWNLGRETILNQSITSGTFTTQQNLREWKMVNSVEFEDKLFSKFKSKEKSSFMDAFYGEERKSNLEVGDYMPAILINPELTEAKQFWQKHDGSYIVINMKTTKSNGTKQWYVEGEAERIH